MPRDDERAQVMVDGLADSPSPSNSHDGSEDAPSLKDPSYPITPEESEDDVVSQHAERDDNPAVPPPVVDDNTKRPPNDDDTNNATTTTTTNNNNTNNSSQVSQKPKTRLSRLYTTPPEAGTPNYGRVLDFTSEEKRDRQRAEKRQSVARNADSVDRRSSSQQPQPHSRRQSRLEESVPRGPPPNYGTVLLFNEDESRPPRTAPKRPTTSAAVKAAEAEREKRFERLSRSRQNTDDNAAPNLLLARKPPARKSSPSHTDRLAAPKKRVVQREDEVISSPPHSYQNRKPVNQDSVNRLSQPRHRQASVTRDPLLSHAREQASRSSYGGTTTVSMPAKQLTPVTHDPPQQRRNSNPVVSWSDIRPAPRPTTALPIRSSLPSSPRGTRKPHAAPTHIPPCPQPVSSASAGAGAKSLKPEAANKPPLAQTHAQAVASQPAAPVVRAAPVEEDTPAAPFAVRAKRRADPDAADEAGAWEPLGAVAATSKPAPPQPAGQSTASQQQQQQPAAVVYAAKRKTPTPASPVAEPSTPPPPPPQATTASAPEPVAASTPAQAGKPVCTRVSVKTRPPPKTAPAHADRTGAVHS